MDAPNAPNEWPRTFTAEELWEAHADALLAWMRARTGNPDVADDWFQEVWLKVFGLDSLPEFQHEFAPRAWLFRVAVRKGIDLGRKDKKRPTPAGDGAAQNVEDPLADQPLESVLQGETLKFLLECLLVLSKLEREVLRLRFRAKEKQSHQKIADALGISRPMSERTTHRAIRRLRDCLEGKFRKGY